MNDTREGWGSRHAIGGLQSVATIASQILADIRQIYLGEYDRADSANSSSMSPGLQQCLEMTYQGKVLLLATRRDELRESFCLDLAQHFALRQDHAVSFYGMTKPALNFVRDLAGHMADIPSDAAIYDGRLRGDELNVLNSVLVELSKAQIYINHGEYLELDCLCEAITKHEQKHSGAGLIVVDNAQQIYSNDRTTETLNNIHKLNQLSETINVPVIALFRLDTGARLSDFLLTRDELALMEKLSIEAGEILLMGGTPEKLLFQPPKVAKREITK